VVSGNGDPTPAAENFLIVNARNDTPIPPTTTGTGG
jgi:hypothetical protein